MFGSLLVNDVSNSVNRHRVVDGVAVRLLDHARRNGLASGTLVEIVAVAPGCNFLRAVSMLEDDDRIRHEVEWLARQTVGIDDTRIRIRVALELRNLVVDLELIDG